MFAGSFFIFDENFHERVEIGAFSLKVQSRSLREVTKSR